MCKLEGSMIPPNVRSNVILGGIIGDYVGSRFEFNNIKSKDFEFFHKDCKFTDDTVLTVAIYNALKRFKTEFQCPLTKTLVDEVVRFCNKYPDAGYGGRFRKWLTNDKRKPYNSLGNGSAMRVSPVAYFNYPEESYLEYIAESTASITHNHPEGIKGAVCLAKIHSMILSGCTKEDIIDLTGEYYYTDFTLDEIREDFKFDETCEGTVPYAIVAFLESKSFEEAVRNAISIGGDSDTLACIAGSLAGAYYGIPYEFIYHIKNEMKENYTDLYETIKDIVEF